MPAPRHPHERHTPGARRPREEQARGQNTRPSVSVAQSGGERQMDRQLRTRRLVWLCNGNPQSPRNQSPFCGWLYAALIDHTEQCKAHSYPVVNPDTPDSGAATTTLQLGTLNCGDCPRRRASITAWIWISQSQSQLDRPPATARRTEYDHSHARQRPLRPHQRSVTAGAITTATTTDDAIRVFIPSG